MFIKLSHKFSFSPIKYILINLINNRLIQEISTIYFRYKSVLVYMQTSYNLNSLQIKLVYGFQGQKELNSVVKNIIKKISINAPNSQLNFLILKREEYFKKILNTQLIRGFFVKITPLTQKKKAKTNLKRPKKS